MNDKVEFEMIGTEKRRKNNRGKITKKEEETGVG